MQPQLDLHIHIPVSLEYIIGGGKLLSVNCRCRGYFVLLNKCNTIQIKPPKTAIPVETPSNVGKSDVNVAISKSYIPPEINVQRKVFAHISIQWMHTFSTKYTFDWL